MPTCVEGVDDRAAVVAARPADRPEPREAAHHHDVLDRDRERPVDELGLGDVRDPPRLPARRPAEDLRPARSTARASPAISLSSVLLPAPFGPDDREQAARLDRDRHVLEGDPLAVARRDVAQPDVRVGERVGGVQRVAVLGWPCPGAVLGRGAGGAPYETQYHLRRRPDAARNGPNGPPARRRSRAVRLTRPMHGPRSRPEGPLSGKSPTPPPSRRSAAPRSAATATTPPATSAAPAPRRGQAASSLISTRNLTIGALARRACWSSRSSRSASSAAGRRGRFVDPGLEYPAAIRDGERARQRRPRRSCWRSTSDFQCPICARHSLDVEPVARQPVRARRTSSGSSTTTSTSWAVADRRVAAAGDRRLLRRPAGQVLGLRHWIYANQQGENRGGFRRERVVAIAEAAGLDGAAFEACLDTPEAAAAFDADQAKANELGINATPTMFLNGTKYVGLKSPSDWAALIEAELAKASASPAASPARPPRPPAARPLDGPGAGQPTRPARPPAAPPRPGRRR